MGVNNKIKYYFRIIAFIIWYYIKAPFHGGKDVLKLFLDFKLWQYVCIFALLYSVWVKDLRYVKLLIT